MSELPLKIWNCIYLLRAMDMVCTSPTKNENFSSSEDTSSYINAFYLKDNKLHINRCPQFMNIFYPDQHICHSVFLYPDWHCHYGVFGHYFIQISRLEFGMVMSIRFVHNGDVWDCVIWLFVDNHVTQSRQYRHSDIAAIPKSTLQYKIQYPRTCLFVVPYIIWV